MKKLRLIIRIATIILILITIAGIVLLIFSNQDPVDKAYEIIAFSLGAAGMILAIVSQIDTYQQEKTTKKLLSDITELNREADADEKVDARFQRKLDSLLDYDQKIYNKLSKKSKNAK